MAHARIYCWNCEAENRRDLNATPDPSCRDCGRLLLPESFDGCNLPANAEPMPKVEPLPTRRRSGFQCPFCGTNRRPLLLNRVSTGGWVVFAVLLVTTIIFFWVGLRIKEDYYVCRDCDLKLE